MHIFSRRNEGVKTIEQNNIYSTLETRRMHTSVNVQVCVCVRVCMRVVGMIV